jgi:hypothetical protein
MSELANIFEKYNLDKLYNKYDSLYEILFANNKYLIKNILEIGIGTTDEKMESSMHSYKKYDSPNYVHGNSLRAWRDYFLNANIYGIDVDENTMFEEDRIKTFCSSSMDKDKMNAIMSKIGLMDIIIDDGLHNLEANITTLEILFPYLKDGGIYIIEDINQHNDFFIDNMLKDKRFLKVLDGRAYEVHSGFNENFTRIVTINNIIK